MMRQVILALTLAMSFAVALGNSREDVIRVSTGSAFGGSLSFEITGSNLVMVRRASVPKGNGVIVFEIVETRNVALDDKTLEALWREIERLGVWQWHRRYDPADLGSEVFDGTSWHVQIRRGDRECLSNGYSVYPALKPLGEPQFEAFDPKLAGPKPTALSELLAMFNKLSSAPNHIQKPM
jgi:hypothetical protein